MSLCPSCGAVRGAHRQEHDCDDCGQEGCTRCMANGLCPRCTDVRRRCFDGTRIDDETGYVTERLAVDLPGEDEELRALLTLAEELRRRLVRLRAKRQALERAASRGRGVWDSPRMRELCGAEYQAGLAEHAVISALCSSGTMTDEIPF